MDVEIFEWTDENEIFDSASTADIPWSNTAVLTDSRDLSITGLMSDDHAMFMDGNDNIHIFMYESNTYYDHYYYSAYMSGFIEETLFTGTTPVYPWANLVSISEDGLSPEDIVSIGENMILVDSSNLLHLLYKESTWFKHRKFTSNSGWSSSENIYSTTLGIEIPWANLAAVDSTGCLDGDMGEGASMLVDPHNNIHVFMKDTNKWKDYYYDGQAWDSFELYEDSAEDWPWVNAASMSSSGLCGSLGENKNSILIDASGKVHIFYYDPSDKNLKHRIFDDTQTNEWSSAKTIYAVTGPGDPRPWSNTMVLKENRETSETMAAEPSMLVDALGNFHVFRYDSNNYYDYVYDGSHSGSWTSTTLLTDSYADTPWVNTGSISVIGLSPSTTALGNDKNAILIDTSGKLHLFFWDDTAAIAGWRHRIFDHTQTQDWSNVKVVYLDSSASQSSKRPWTNTMVLKENGETSGSMTENPSMLVDPHGNFHAFRYASNNYYDYVYDGTYSGSWAHTRLLTDSPTDLPWVNTGSIYVNGLSPSPTALGNDKNAMLIDTFGKLHVFFWDDEPPIAQGWRHRRYDHTQTLEWSSWKPIYAANRGDPRPWTTTMVMKANRELSGSMTSDPSMLVDNLGNFHIFNYESGNYNSRAYDSSHSGAWNGYTLFSDSEGKEPWPWIASISEDGLFGNLGTNKNSILVDASSKLHLLFWDDSPSPSGWKHRKFDHTEYLKWCNAKSIYTANEGDSRPWTNTMVQKDSKELDGDVVEGPSMLVDGSGSFHIWRYNSNTYYDYAYDGTYSGSWTEYGLFGDTYGDEPWINTASIYIWGLSESLGTNVNSLLIDASSKLHLFYWDDSNERWEHKMYDHTQAQDWSDAKPIYTADQGDKRPWTNTMVLKWNRELHGSMTADPSMLVDALGNFHIWRYASDNYYDYVYDGSYSGSWSSTTLFSDSHADQPWVNTASIATTRLDGSLGNDMNAILIDTSGRLNLLYWDDGQDRFESLHFVDGTGWSASNLAIYYSNTGADRPWKNTMVLKENRGLSGSMTDDPSMFVDAFDDLHIFRYYTNVYRDYVYDTSHPGSWTEYSLFMDTRGDEPWVNIASIATSALDGSLGSTENAILSDVTGDLHLLYFEDDSGGSLAMKSFVQGSGWSSLPHTFYSATTAGQARPWTNTKVVLDDRSVYESSEGSASLVVDQLKGVFNGGKGDNLHFFWYDTASYDWKVHTYTWDDGSRTWKDVTLFNCRVDLTLGPPWNNVGSVSETGFSGDIDPNENAILIDSTGRSNLLYYDNWPIGLETLYHRAFVTYIAQ